MAEPENQTLHLLREIREVVRDFDKKLGALDKKVERNHVDVSGRLDNIRQAAFGESVLGRYAVAEVEERLDAIEKRLKTLEKQR